METPKTIQEKIIALANKYSIDNLGLDEATYRKILAEEIKKNLSLLTDSRTFKTPVFQKKR